MDAPIYSDLWKSWTDPDIPEFFNPTEFLLDRHAGGGNAQKTALIVEDVAVSFAQLRAEVCRAANGLQRIGLPADSRILVFATDSLATVSTWLAAVRCGVVPAGISELYKAHQLAYFLRDTAATALFTDEAQFGKLGEAGDDLPATLRKVIVNGEVPEHSSLSGRGIEVVSYADLVAGMADEATPVPRHRNDVTYMFYSGGTTGTAKGITHLAHDFILVPERHGPWWEYTSDDIVFATSKKYFTHGLWPGLLIPLYYGATSIITSAPPRPDVVTAIVEAHKPTKLITVPTAIKLLLAHFDEMDREPEFGSIRAVYSASEKMPPEIFERWHERFGVELMDSIGSSEVTYEWIANRPGDFRRGSLGKPVSGVEIRLVDDDGNDVTQPDTPGECWVKSRTACLFYWRKFDETKKTFQGAWVRTGDQLQFDEDGYFWFAGRSNDVFKVKGLWVSPIEIEAAITRDQRILEAAVIGIEGDDGLTTVKAFVVLRSGVAGDDALIEDLKARVREEAGGYKVPGEIVFAAELPRTTLQKIDRRALRDQEAAKQS
ncbi:MAG: benzoate-CoA ligase family protein [Rhodobiaceae bacterium]|nr:benzoate-CoA ligase family protein [Rhodobiaceae bacterium]MCC0049769.1 benzoate-CoA ligase family protein [Rhodobiaceae bacterium]